MLAIKRSRSIGDALDDQACELSALGAFRVCLGGRVNTVAIGGAASDPTLMSFLEKCFGYSNAHELYGATECGSITRDGFGMPNVEVKLLAVPELEISPSDEPWPCGELCVHTMNMAHSIVAGSDLAFIHFDGRLFYRTGDAAELRPPTKSGGRARIQLLGRVSDIVKFSNGLYVALETVEQVIEARCDHIEHIFLHSEKGSDELVAVLVPDQSAPLQWTAAEWTDQILGLVHTKALASHCVPSRIFIDRTHRSWRKLGLLATQSKKRGPLISRHYKTVIEQLSLGTNKATENNPPMQLQSPTTPAEKLQAMILLQLNISTTTFEQIGKDSWTHVGGDSINAIALAHHLSLFDPSRQVTASDVLTASSLQQLDLSLTSGSENSVSSPEIDWRLEYSLPYDIVCPDSTETLTPVVLLTGASGFLGTFLLAELLKRGVRKVVCLGRASSDKEATDRVMHSLVLYRLCQLDTRVIWPFMLEISQSTILACHLRDIASLWIL